MKKKFWEPPETAKPPFWGGGGGGAKIRPPPNELKFLWCIEQTQGLLLLKNFEKKISRLGDIGLQKFHFNKEITTAVSKILTLSLNLRVRYPPCNPFFFHKKLPWAVCDPVQKEKNLQTKANMGFFSISQSWSLQKLANFRRIAILQFFSHRCNFTVFFLLCTMKGMVLEEEEEEEEEGKKVDHWNIKGGNNVYYLSPIQIDY